MKLSELIAAYGDEKVEFQNLDECTSAMNMNRKGSKITFGTDQRFDLNGTVQLGLIVWLDRDKVAEIVAKIETLDPLSEPETAPTTMEARIPDAMARIAAAIVNASEASPAAPEMGGR